MPPQNQPAPNAASGQFDFMMKEQPKPPGRFSSLLSGVPKLAKIALLAIAVIFVLVIIYALFFGNKTTNSQQMIAVASRAQEIARVSELVQQGSKNTDSISLATTVDESMTSQEQQIKDYLLKQKIKIDPKNLLTHLDKNTDKQLEAAQPNNAYDQTYYDYLKTNLVSYQDSLSTAYKNAGKNGRALLNAANHSVKTILSAPQLK